DRDRGSARQRDAAPRPQLGPVPPVGKGPVHRPVAALLSGQPVLMPGAFSGKVGTGFPKEMRPAANPMSLAAAGINAALVAGSIVAFLLICEFFVFRVVLPASDVPANAFVNGLVRFRANQTGIWRVRNEIAAPYAINAQGWNSGIGDYAVARRPGVARVAVVGDSYVEALPVAHDKSLGERLAAELSRAGRPVEVYRFGISGAPLSQYLYMVEREVTNYAPDWIVVVLVHNDFDESINQLQGRY